MNTEISDPSKNNPSCSAANANQRLIPTKPGCLPVCMAAIAGMALSASVFAAPADWIGKTLPSMGMETISGKLPTTGPMIVEFWATWCPPCQASIPHLNGIYNKYKAQGLQIVGVSNEDKATINSFTKTTPINYVVALDNGKKFSSNFNITGIPTAFLVNKEGKIVWTGHPMKLAEADIEKILK